MPGPKHPNVIDGLSSIRAVRRAGESGHGRPFKTRASPDRLPDRPGSESARPDPRSPASRIGHTVRPEQHDLLCYECGYAFVIRGRIHQPICPKCHRKLINEDLCITTEWSGDVKTIGNVEIKDGGEILAGRITARDIIVEGNARKGVLQAGRRLELGPGARFNLATVQFKDLRIRPRANLSIRGTLVCHDLLVEGRLKTTVQSTGKVRIAPGGHLIGRLATEHLMVEDGGGLSARLDVGTNEMAPDTTCAGTRKNG